MQGHRRPSILLVDDDPTIILALRRALAELGAIRFAVNGAEALRLAREDPPDIVLLDAEMPGLSGFEVCAALKADECLAGVPVVFVTSHTDPGFEETGLDLGAADFIAKPINPRIVAARVRTQLRLRLAYELLRDAAATDALTSLHNRRSFDAALRTEWSRSLRLGQPLALLMIDVDHFKRYNDHYGHAAGDECLRHVANAMARSVRRASDFVARYGGEEFAMLLPGTDASGAHFVASSVLAELAEMHIPHAASPAAPYVTVSIGASALDPASAAWAQVGAGARPGDCEATPPRALVQAADLALYEMKRSGRAGCREVPLDLALGAGAP